MSTRAPQPGLSTLDRVVIPPARLEFIEALAAQSQGSAAWRGRKRVEATELLALEHISPRMQVMALDLTTDLLAAVRLRVPVPCRPNGDELVVADAAELVLRYPPSIPSAPLPGFAMVRIASPRPTWHPNISPESDQSVCLGANIPTGLPLREAVLGTYAALTLQSISLDRADPAGIMNGEALAYFTERTDLIPLSTEPFLEPISGPAMTSAADTPHSPCTSQEARP